MVFKLRRMRRPSVALLLFRHLGTCIGIHRHFEAIIEKYTTDETQIISQNCVRTLTERKRVPVCTHCTNASETYMRCGITQIWPPHRLHRKEREECSTQCNHLTGNRRFWAASPTENQFSARAGRLRLACTRGVTATLSAQRPRRGPAGGPAPGFGGVLTWAGLEGQPARGGGARNAGSVRRHS